MDLIEIKRNMQTPTHREGGKEGFVSLHSIRFQTSSISPGLLLPNISTSILDLKKKERLTGEVNRFESELTFQEAPIESRADFNLLEVSSLLML